MSGPYKPTPVTPPAPHDYAETLRLYADLLQQQSQAEQLTPTSIGIVITFSNGQSATAFEGEQHSHLLGALEVLRTRISRRIK